MGALFRAGTSFRPHVRGDGAPTCVVALCLALVFAVVCGSTQAFAAPSFARQTGQPCASCHTAFPELTPFGRRFKLGGCRSAKDNNTLLLYAWTAF